MGAGQTFAYLGRGLLYAPWKVPQNVLGEALPKPRWGAHNANRPPCCDKGRRKGQKEGKVREKKGVIVGIEEAEIEKRGKGGWEKRQWGFSPFLLGG